jgi:hypothetical protein
MGAFSDRLWADIETWELGDAEGAVKFRILLGPVGALNPAGPRGGDLGAAGRTGERSLGVDFAESLSLSLSLYASWCGGDLARGGERALESRADVCDTSVIRSG